MAEGQHENGRGEQRARHVGVASVIAPRVAAPGPRDCMQQAYGKAGHRGDQRQGLPPGWEEGHPEGAVGAGNHFEPAAVHHSATPATSPAASAGLALSIGARSADGWLNTTTGYPPSPSLRCATLVSPWERARELTPRRAP